MTGARGGWGRGPSDSLFLFPASTIKQDTAAGRAWTRSLRPTAVQREVSPAARASGILNAATAHTFRHSIATEALRGGCDIRTLQQVMGHKDLRPTSLYLPVIVQSGGFIRSPLDRPDEPAHDPGRSLSGCAAPDVRQRSRMRLPARD